MKHQIMFSRLILPTPLPPEQVVDFLTRLAADSTRPTIVLETRATADGITQLIGCPPAQVEALRRLVTTLIPGSLIVELGSYRRRAVYSSGTLTAKPPGLPLRSDTPESVTQALFSALSRPLADDDTIVVQLVLGPSLMPERTADQISDPIPLSVAAALLTGKTPADRETRNRVSKRIAQYGFRCAIRIGVLASTEKRRHRMALDITASMAVAQAPGVKIRLKRDDPNALNNGTTPRWWHNSLSVSELVPFTAWPIGKDQLPSMPPLHPRMLRAAENVHSASRVFATSLVPGDDRELGIRQADSLFHGFALGPTGVGKTTMMQHLIEADIASGAPVLVVDPKHQIPDYLLARIPRERWDDVVILDASDPNPIGFNPLDATGRDPDVVADGILAVFKKTFSDGWGPRTADIFSASLRTLARTSTEERPNTLVDIQRLWLDAGFRQQQVAAIQDDITLVGFWAWFDSMKPATLASVIAAPMNKLRQVLLRPAAVRMLGARNTRFRLRDMFRDGKIVLVPLNEGLIGPLTAELIGSLVIADAWQAVQERASEPGHEQRPGFVYVDEADRLFNLPVSLADALARSRSLSVSWFLATQFWDQLPHEMKSAVKTNARNKIVFRLESDEDARTIAKLAPGLTDLDFMSLGKHEIYVRLVADGITTDWALARTLPPTPEQQPADRVRRYIEAKRPPTEPPPPVVHEAPPPPSAEAHEPPIAAAANQPVPRIPGAVGRKKRSHP
ncbi:type IV secretory system conjugative DNA transfer family protein [Gulosibacter molinativorax]|uniref:Type IV secretion system coupling protein TraD DNA-binding domain-containing protein n=1 Tax=Gulosibacter molinativorax TaxID=256821 RepID=A0ABT7CD94_9MICO|nr:type IV secretion system DNA-binding domain-containing protein [Gulosibacter molinativorax]MDJ1372659.1 hypothetical protein [Gulosibacter molinativorax]QUY62395.1 Hypothetical protein GMOLON4_1692 [Gulosibacter molinativorax]